MAATLDNQASILVVDDQGANLTALEAILEPLGQKLLLVRSGEEALKQLMLHEDVAVILLDVRMPGIDGFETARLIKMRDRSRFIPIVFLTGLGEDEGALFRGYEHGAVDYIRKPFDADVLRSKVRVFVELHQRGVALQRQAQLLREHELAAIERRHEERYRSLIDAMPQCVWALGPDGEIQYANEGWRSYAALRRGETTLEVLRRFIHPEDAPVMEVARRRALDGISPFEVQFRLRRAHDGAWRWHLGRGVPHRDDRGTVLGWVITATDIHDQKQIESALQQTEQALRKASEAKDVFLAAASHELRTPLTVVKAQTALTLRRLAKAGGDAERSLTMIDRQIGRMVRLVEDLLDVGRLQSGRLSLEWESFDLVELLSETRERMQLLSDAHPIELHAPEALPIEADRHRLEQVFTNLVANAIRYSPDGGSVRLDVADEGDRIRISVHDEGVGIPLDRQTEIFEQFGQAHGVRYGGLGLGLTIAAGIVGQHGGRIWVESDGKPGAGTTFHVEMPRAAELGASGLA
ncbi:sensor histidine kinase [Vulgatibacter sp.]|uniref:sensor histidine kinase n=1 Tax=Vulgatibacter sp. TaxID=1971226 RepID=UPI003562F860